MSPRQTRSPHSDCEQFQDRLQVALDERRDPQADPELKSHATLCGRCARLLSLQASLWGCVHEWAVQSNDRGADETAATDSRSDVQVSCARADGEWQISGWRGAVALASVLLVSVVALRFGPDWSGGNASSGRAFSTRMAERFPQRTSAPRSRSLLAAGLRGQGRGRSGSAESRSSAALHLGPVGLESWVAQFGLLNDTVSDLPLERISEVPEMTGVQDLTDGMRPAARSVGSVIQVLWRNVPAPRSEGCEFRMPDTSARIVRTCIC